MFWIQIFLTATCSSTCTVNRDYHHKHNSCTDSNRKAIRLLSLSIVLYTHENRHHYRYRWFPSWFLPASVHSPPHRQAARHPVAIFAWALKNTATLKVSITHSFAKRLPRAFIRKTMKCAYMAQNDGGAQNVIAPFVDWPHRIKRDVVQLVNNPMRAGACNVKI